jgi:hypothetical protein
MPRAEINDPGLLLVGRFSGDPHWPLLGTPEGPTPKSAQFQAILPRGLQLWFLLRLAALVGLSEPRFTAKRENCRPPTFN